MNDTNPELVPLRAYCLGMCGKNLVDDRDVRWSAINDPDSRYMVMICDPCNLDRHWARLEHGKPDWDPQLWIRPDW
jgi:hypothetical protein